MTYQKPQGKIYLPRGTRKSADRFLFFSLFDKEGPREIYLKRSSHRRVRRKTQRIPLVLPLPWEWTEVRASSGFHLPLEAVDKCALHSAFLSRDFRVVFVFSSSFFDDYGFFRRVRRARAVRCRAGTCQGTFPNHACGCPAAAERGIRPGRETSP